MKARILILSGLCALLQAVAGLPSEGGTTIQCGQILTADTVLEEDLTCPPGTDWALQIGASNITLDLGGHVVSGHAPGTGVLAVGQDGLIVRNGIIAGFNDGIFTIGSDHVTLEHLTVRNLDITDPNHLIMGLHIDSGQHVVVRDVLFEFPSVAHKEAINLFGSDADISDIEVRGGGAGVNFSFAGSCDPVNSPSNGTVRNSKFSDAYVAGVEVQCSSRAWIEGNDFSTPPGIGIGIQIDAPASGDVTGLTIRDNVIHDTMLGIEARGMVESTISHNHVFRSGIWGIALRQSLGCLAPETGWDCFDSTANRITDNVTWGNATDLYHFEGSTGNNWSGNACETREGAEIPECLTPTAALTIDYASGAPGSFFRLEGANFAADAGEAITVNGVALGTVLTDASGDLAFLLDTVQASEGEYLVTAGAGTEAGSAASASARFVVDADKRIRPREGEGTVFPIPPGIGVHRVRLALVEAGSR